MPGDLRPFSRYSIVLKLKVIEQAAGSTSSMFISLTARILFVSDDRWAYLKR